jgi:hypothetical protein
VEGYREIAKSHENGKDSLILAKEGEG